MCSFIDHMCSFIDHMCSFVDHISYEFSRTYVFIFVYCM
jgi:hypothetical protein